MNAHAVQAGLDRKAWESPVILLAREAFFLNGVDQTRLVANACAGIMAGMQT